jgi:membrane fusion protein, multidrug efflux system
VGNLLRRSRSSPGPVVALLFGAALCNAATADEPPALAVTIAHPLSEHITTWDEYSGRFVAVKSVDVRPRVSGFIDKVNFVDGAMVKSGDPLFTIDQRPFAIALDSAKAEVARAAAQVKVTAADVERAKPLVGTNAISGRDYDQRAASFSVAQAQLQVAQAAEKAAQLNFEWTEVRAPITGRISDKKVNEGNLVNGGSGSTTLLATIVSLDPIQFLFEVSESDYLRYTRANLSGARRSSRDVSNPVRIRLADEKDWTHVGKMDFVDNQLDARTGTIRGRALMDNKDQLFTPGVFGRIELFAGEVDAILIPDRAVISDQTRKIVFALDADDKVVPKPVVLGGMHEGMRVVLSGLDTDDRIVVDGIANPAVRPGVKVKPELADAKAANN